MKEQIQVSVIVVTYNPESRALQATLDSIVCQTGVNWEIILTDDGSNCKDFSWLPAYFDEHQIQNYCLLENPENMGTIRNILQGVQVAQGKYVYTIAPGDLLFDAHTIKDFYNFAEEKGCALCFGNSVYYSVENGVPQLSNGGKSVPRNPEAYGRSRLLDEMNFFFGDWICGVSYFHNREIWMHYLRQATEICRYAEDASTTALALADGERIWYYDRHIAWYEYGSGISTDGSTKWNNILRQEFEAIIVKLRDLHPENQMVRIAQMDYTEMSRWNIRIVRMLRYPRIMLIKMLFLPKKKQRILSVTRDELDYLQSILSGESEWK